MVDVVQFERGRRLVVQFGVGLVASNFELDLCLARERRRGDGRCRGQVGRFDWIGLQTVLQIGQVLGGFGKNVLDRLHEFGDVGGALRFPAKFPRPSVGGK